MKAARVRVCALVSPTNRSGCAVTAVAAFRGDGDRTMDRLRSATRLGIRTPTPATFSSSVNRHGPCSVRRLQGCEQHEQIRRAIAFVFIPNSRIIIRHARRRAEPVRRSSTIRLELDFRAKTEAGPRRPMVLR